MWCFCISYNYLCVLTCLSSFGYVDVLFCGFLGLKLLFMAMCLTLIDYCVVLYGSVIPCPLYELMLQFPVF
jgi:hypothetical protein